MSIQPQEFSSFARYLKLFSFLGLYAQSKEESIPQTSIRLLNQNLRKTASIALAQGID